MSQPWPDLISDQRLPRGPIRWRRALPLLVALAACVAVAAPMLAPAPVVPLLPLLCVMVWSVYQPRLMPPWAALLVGVASDLAMATPLGINATLMPLLALLLGAGGIWAGPRPFALDWLLAGLVIAVYQALAVGLAGLIGPPRDPGLLVAQTLLSWAILPAVARLAAWTQRIIGIQ